MTRLRRANLIDVLLVAAIGGVGLVEVVVNPMATGPLYVDIPVVGVAGVSVALRRRYPLTTTVAFAAAVALQSAFGSPPPEMAMAFPGLLLFPYAVAANSTLPRAVAGLAVIVVLVPVVDRLAEDTRSTDIFPSVLSTLSFVAGRAVHSRSRLAAELHEAAVLADEEREAQAAQAVADERRRIAREMHDVVAHSISVMVVQAGGARRVLEKGDAGRAADAAAQIEATGREAMTEMRRLLGVLHPSEDRAMRAPQPGMAGLDSLIARARQAGLPLELREQGERRDLPPGVDLAAYRILQEGLTNAIKYAGGAETEVEVLWGVEDIRLAVVDRGPGEFDDDGSGDGHGLIGMRERVRLYGGELHTGLRRGGGYELRARLPLNIEEEA